MDELIKTIFKRRILSGAIDFIISIYFAGAINFITEPYMVSPLFYPLGLLVIFIYFGLTPKITNGYTIGGFITQMKFYTLDSSPINIWNQTKRAFDLFVFFWKVIYTHNVMINNFMQLKPDIKYNITLLPNNFDLQTLDKKENWSEVDYYFFYFPTVFKSYFFVWLVLTCIDYIQKLIIETIK